MIWLHPMIWLLGCAPRLEETLFLRHEGADLRIRLEGPVDPSAIVLLLHGGPGGNSEEYNVGAWAEQVEAEVAMAYLDQRGQGASQGVYASSSVSVMQLAEDVDAVLGLLATVYPDASLWLMGHSWGGALGTVVLLDTRAADHLSGWIEVDGAHDVPLLNQLAVPMLRAVGEEEIAAGRNVDAWSEIVDFAAGVDVNNITPSDSSLINRYGYEAERLVGAVSDGDGDSALALLRYYTVSSVGWPNESVVGNHTAALLADESELVALSARLPEITVPTLLVWGAYDFVVPAGLGEDARRRIPDARMVTLPRAGHVPMFNQPEAFSTALLDFIAVQSNNR